MTALLHYFFLATFTWTLCEAVLIYNLLVKVFGANDRKWLYIYLAVGWGTQRSYSVMCICVAYISLRILAIQINIYYRIYLYNYSFDFCNTFFYVVAPIPVVVISAAIRHDHYLIRYSHDEGSPHYNEIKA